MCLNRSASLFSYFVVITLLGVAAVAAPGPDAKINSVLVSQLAGGEDATAPFFIVFADRADLKPAHRIANRAQRGRYVVQSLMGVAQRSQNGVRGYLRGQNIAFTAFWVENKIYVPQGTLELARAVAQRPEVAAIIPEVVYSVPPTQQAAGDAGTQSVEWNISKIRANQVWADYGKKGDGMVVANIDTGVQYNHPALVRQYRGNNGNGTFTHTGNFSDPTGVCGGTPCDNNGHGSHTMGTMVGETADLVNQVGVSPAAKWIACKGCATNSCASSALTSCAQVMLDPNADGSGSDQPDVVNNSWGGSGGNSWYSSYVNNWRAAGIFPAFSNGNSGSACNTAGSPGDYPESFAAGATDSNDVIASFSSRGPSAFGGIIKPDVSAPGVSVRSSVPTNGYASYSGTSMASPHVAGLVALLWSVAPSYRGNIGGTESLLESTAVGLTTTQSCGGVSGSSVPNNTYGRGRIDALAAAQAAVGTPVNNPPTVSISSPAAGSYPCGQAISFNGAASDPEQGNLSSSIVWTDNGAAFFTGASTSRTYACPQTGNHNVVATITDSKGAADTDSVTISIYDPNVPAAPSNLNASVSGATVTLTFTDNSNNETGFKVERSKKGANAWSVVKTIPSGTVSTTDTPGRGNWDYRVKAYNSSGDSAPSNVRSVRVRP